MQRVQSISLLHNYITFCVINTIKLIISCAGRWNTSQRPPQLSKMSAKKSSRLSEQVTGAVHKYISRRKLDTKRSRCVSLEEMTSRSVMNSAASTSNIILFSYTSIDHSMAESQYTAFKFWISESEDFYKPELAQLLYPLFTHLYIALLTNCPNSPSPSPSSTLASTS